MRLIPQFGIVALMTGLAIGGWQWLASPESGDGGDRRARQSGPVAVETAAARLGTVRETVAAVGVTRAVSSVRIVPTASGLVTRIAFQSGQRVEAGAMLVELDSASERAAVSEAESELANLRRQVGRAETLRAQRLLSAADLDDLRSRLGIAEARLAAARGQLDKRLILAPFAGVVGLRNINLGDFVDSNTILTTLDDLETVELEFRIPERYFRAVRTDQTVAATSVAFPGQTFAGVVHEVDTRIDAATRSFRVRAAFPNPDTLLPDGLFMAVSLVVAERVDAVLVPEEAIISEGGESYLYVVDGATAAKTTIVLGQRLDAGVEVRAGLAPGSEVVTRGHQSLRDQSPIRPVGERAADQSPGDRPRHAS
jgi:membrane fusion protein, multidrug efflux system